MQKRVQKWLVFFIRILINRFPLHSYKKKRRIVGMCGKGVFFMPRKLLILLFAIVINTTGAAFLWPLNTIYVHNHLGKSLSMAGIVLMINSGVMIIGNLAGGTLFDKYGGFKTIMFGSFIATISSIGLSMFHQWPFYPVFLVILGLGSGIVFPAVSAYAAAIWPEGGRKVFNAMYVAQNVGVAVGTALCGFVVDKFSYDYAFMANTTLYTLFFCMILFGVGNVKIARKSKQLEKTLDVENSRTTWFAFVMISIGFLFLWISYVQWTTTVASYTQELHISITSYALLWTINGGVIVIGQPLIGPIIKRLLPTLKQQIIVGYSIFIISFIFILTGVEFWQFVVAMIILTIGEMIAFPAVPTIASQLAPLGKDGAYQGYINSVATAGRMIGPLLGGMIADFFGMRALFAVLIGLIIIAIATTAIYDRKLEKVSLEDERVG